MTYDLRDMYQLAPKRKRTDGPQRLCALREGLALDVLQPDAQLPQTRTRAAGNPDGSQGMAMQETVLILTIKHDKPLPDLLRDKVEAYAYDYATARGVKVEVEAKVWYALEVRG